MKKGLLAIIILLGIATFASLDYYLNINNKPGVKSEEIIIDTAQEKVVEKVNTEVPKKSEINLIQSLLNKRTDLTYKIAKRNRATQLFEKFDLSTLKSVKIYKNELTKKDESIVIAYEIQANKGQGGIIYIALKSLIKEQIDATGGMNEVSSYGYNAFFYNDINRENTVFLLTQIGDSLYGFQSNKQSFKIIESMIETLNAS